MMRVWGYKLTCAFVLVKLCSLVTLGLGNDTSMKTAWNGVKRLLGITEDGFFNVNIYNNRHLSTSLFLHPFSLSNFVWEQDNKTCVVAGLNELFVTRDTVSSNVDAGFPCS